MMVSNRNLLFQGSIFLGSMLIFWGCNYSGQLYNICSNKNHPPNLKMGDFLFEKKNVFFPAITMSVSQIPRGIFYSQRLAGQRHRSHAHRPDVEVCEGLAEVETLEPGGSNPDRWNAEIATTRPNTGPKKKWVPGMSAMD